MCKLTGRRISSKAVGKLACRRICLLNPRDGRRGAPGSMRMVSAAPMARREASAPSSYCVVPYNRHFLTKPPIKHGHQKHFPNRIIPNISCWTENYLSLIPNPCKNPHPKAVSTASEKRSDFHSPAHPLRQVFSSHSSTPRAPNTLSLTFPPRPYKPILMLSQKVKKRRFL